jgi:hypothetical protein
MRAGSYALPVGPLERCVAVSRSSLVRAVSASGSVCARASAGLRARIPSAPVLAVAAVAGWGILWVHVHLALMPYLLEDSYIHLRIADHLARFGVPHFNVGEAVKASSSSVWTLLLASLFSLWPRNVKGVLIACALISTAGLVSYVALMRAIVARRLAVWEAVTMASVYVALTQIASIAAMETPLAILFLTLGLHAYLRQRPWAFACLTLAAVTRVELVPLVLLMALAALLTRSLPIWRSAGWAFAAGVPFVIYDLVSFGTVVPHALVVKPLIHHSTLPEAFALVAPEAVTYLSRWSPLVVCAALLGYFVLATLPIARMRWSRAALMDRTTHVLVGSAVAGLTVAAAYVSARSLVFAWYRPLYFVPLFVPAVAGAAMRRSGLAYCAVLVAASPALLDLTGTLAAAGGHPEAYRYFLDGARSRRTLQVAAELYRQYPDATLMTAEIGAAGFGFLGRIEDGAAIASPRALAYHPLPVPSERRSESEAPVPRMFVRDLRPGIVMSVDRFLCALWRDPIVSEYVHIRTTLYRPEDDARRHRDLLLWANVRYLDVLIRRDLWEQRHHDEPTIFH